MADVPTTPEIKDYLLQQVLAEGLITNEQAEEVAEEHKRMAFILLSAIARTLAIRLRHDDDELILLQEN